MRIIAGTAGSIPLLVPPGVTRPTSDRVREAVFSSLAPQLEGARVLDLFAGSGAMGLESLSRGAVSATFVEKDRLACEVITKNLAKTRLAGGEVVCRDVVSFLSAGSPGPYDLVFADPPYARDEVSTALLAACLHSAGWPPLLSSQGLCILETLAATPLLLPPQWRLIRQRDYGKTRIHYLELTV